eukprot:jgi/Ulvmu1/12166/UM085_0030.1
MSLEDNVRVTSTAAVFDVIKVRKQINFLPLKVEFGLDWSRVTGEKAAFLSVKDRLIDGSIEVQRHEVKGPQLLYRKSISSPVGGMQLRMGFNLNGLRGEPFAPFFGIGYDLGQGNNFAQLTDGNGIDFSTRVPLARKYKIEVCGNIKLPLPAAQYDLGSAHNGVTGSLSLGEGALEVNVAQINPVLYV